MSAIDDVASVLGVDPQTVVRDVRAHERGRAEQRAVMLYVEGEKLNAIAFQTGLNPSKISALARRAQVPLRGRGRPHHSRMVDDAIEADYRAGRRYNDIVRERRVSSEYIRMLLHERGIPRRGKGRTTPPAPKPPEAGLSAQVEHQTGRMANGMTFSEAARRLYRIARGTICTGGTGPGTP